MPRASVGRIKVFSSLCLVVLTLLCVQISFTSAEEVRFREFPTPKTLPSLPPGFFGPNIIEDPDLWNPGTPGQCDVVYSASMSSPIPYRIQGGGNPVIGDMNYLFYFPVENTVLSFIDPRLARIYPKGVLDGKFGIAVNFEYGGGFPHGFVGLGPQDVLGGKVTYPIPGDKFSRVVVSEWPFIKRSQVLFDYPKHCRFNKDCFCIRKSK
jgi:hypothetical protein